tara:strand:- start:335 stop:766 length:432 start_codon:yes stop_codon:yes gene_type:complete
MKRAKYIEKRSILSEVKYTIKAIILLPIMIVLLPFKLLSRAVFYLGHQDKYIRLDKDVYNELKKQSRDINELQLSLESLKPIDLGDFNFISDEPTQIELAQIEAELYGESVARKEYDWHREQKAKDKQIQDRMRKDEAEFLND